MLIISVGTGGGGGRCLPTFLSVGANKRGNSVRSHRKRINGLSSTPTPAQKNCVPSRRHFKAPFVVVNRYTTYSWPLQFLCRSYTYDAHYINQFHQSPFEPFYVVEAKMWLVGQNVKLVGHLPHQLHIKPAPPRHCMKCEAGTGNSCKPLTSLHADVYTQSFGRINSVEGRINSINSSPLAKKNRLDSPRFASLFYF